MDAAFIRTIGGCLIGLGIGALTMIYTVLKQNKQSLFGLLGMVTMGEGMNSSQMTFVRSPFFFFPFFCVVIMWMGDILYWFGKKD